MGEAVGLFAVEPTEEQQRINEAARAGESMCIEALAGSGKTTQLEMLARVFAPEPQNKPDTLYLTYNTSMAKAAERRFEGRAIVKTYHGLAFSNFGYLYRTRLVGDTFAVVQALIESGRLDRYAQRPAQTEFASAVMDVLVRWMASDSKGIGAEHAITVDAQKFDVAAVLEAAQQTWDAMLDPSGSFPFLHDAYVRGWLSRNPRLGGRFKRILFDEAQDANAAAFAITERQTDMARIYVGDTNQSIYGFRLAINALERLDLPRYSLTTSWRFGPNIAQFVNRILAAKGQTLRVVGGAAVAGEVVENKGEADVVLARTNAGLIEEAIAEIQAGRKVSIVRGTKQMLKVLGQASDLFNRGAGFGPFANWNDLVAASQTEQGATFAPYVRLVTTHRGKTPQLISMLERNTVPVNRAQVRLSTSHGFKGDEARSVRCAGDYRAFRSANNPSKPFELEEANLMYVTATRAKERLDLGAAAGAFYESIAGVAADSAPLVHRNVVAPVATPRVEDAPEPIASSVSTATPPDAPAVPAPSSAPPAAPKSSADQTAMGAEPPMPAAQINEARTVSAPRTQTEPKRTGKAKKRYRLSVPEADRFKAMRVGAIWDGREGAWFVPIGAELSVFSEWHPSSAEMGDPAESPRRESPREVTAEYRATISRPGVAIRLDYVPNAVPHSGLRASMTREAWLELRSRLLAERGSRCAMCGDEARLEVHECWHLDRSAGLAELTDVTAVCPPCHEAQHLERAALRGRVRAIAQYVAERGSRDVDDVSKDVEGLTAACEADESRRWRVADVRGSVSSAVS